MDTPRASARKEVLPNPADVFQSLRYLQDQAARGRFDGHTPAYLVLTYLVTNMWVKTGNRENAGIGEVMYGRSSIESIAAGTTLCRSSVQRALRWLAESEWVDAQRSLDVAGREDRKRIIVRMDMAAHRTRERMQEAGEALEKMVGEGVPQTPPGRYL